ncbi:hypothetical protein BHM03_00059659 [Ensete ventricosum]|nr:hypothetical protein BHM03_00059659 [Ensete ventricosum]
MYLNVPELEWSISLFTTGLAGLVAESRGRSAEAQEPHAPYRGTPHLITMSNRTKRRPPPDLSDGDEIPHPRLPKAIPGGSKPPHASPAVVAVPAGGTKTGKICMAEMKHPFLSTNSKRKKETSGSSLKPQDRPSLSPAKNKQKLVIADISTYQTLIQMSKWKNIFQDSVIPFLIDSASSESWTHRRRVLHVVYNNASMLQPKHTRYVVPTSG